MLLIYLGTLTFSIPKYAIEVNKTEDTVKKRKIAERLLAAVKTMGPLKRRPGFGPPEPPGFEKHHGHGPLARPGEFQLLRHLGHEPEGTGPRVGDLAGKLGIKPPSVSQLVDALEAKGLVERYADDDDRRAIRIRLSPSGREMAAAFHEHAMAEVMALVEYLGEADGERLAELLAKAGTFFADRYDARHDHEHCHDHSHPHSDSDKGVE